jgi:hypothetical protein
MRIPPTGEVVLRNGRRDWLCQLRLGDEQFVLVWGATNERWRADDLWSAEMTAPRSEVGEAIPPLFDT